MQLSKKFAVRAANVCGLAGWLSVFFSFFASKDFDRASRLPNAQTGEIVPYESHGGVHYITVLQNRFWLWPLIFGMATMVIAALIILTVKKLRNGTD